MTDNGLRKFDDVNFIECPTLRDACLNLAEDAAHALAKAVAVQGGAFIAVPGGTSPAPFFESMAARALEWAKVRVTLTDERWVSEDSAESNTRLVRLALLRDFGAAAIFAPPRTPDAAGSISIRDAAASWDIALKGEPAFDLVVLGMGDDGHFASLFLGGENLAANLDPESGALAVAVTDRTPPRLSLTLRAIIRAKKIALLIGGEKKQALLDKVLRGDAETADLPIAVLLHRLSVTPTFYWGALT
jgi:6-phosphogluconolactonase